jgi:hypothetical protein
MTALARVRSNCKRQIRPVVRENAPRQQTRNCLTVKKTGREPPDGCFIPRTSRQGQQRKHRFCYSVIVAVETRLFAQLLLSNGCYIVAYFAVVA